MLRTRQKEKEKRLHKFSLNGARACEERYEKGHRDINRNWEDKRLIITNDFAQIKLEVKIPQFTPVLGLPPVLETRHEINRKQCIMS